MDYVCETMEQFLSSLSGTCLVIRYKLHVFSQETMMHKGKVKEVICSIKWRAKEDFIASVLTIANSMNMDEYSRVPMIDS